MKPSVDIVVLNWNGGDDTVACLASLARVDYPRLRVVVVDNGSTDDSADRIAALFPAIPLLRTGANRGYAGGNNVGIRHCLANDPAEFCLLLNNDTIVDPSFVGELVEAAARHPEAGLFSPKIYFASRPRVLWFAGARWNRLRSDFFHVGYDEVDGAADVDAPDATDAESSATDFASGCALFFRRDVPARIGTLDERYFLLFEEVDYCYRARRAGFGCVVAPRAKVWHKVSSAMGAWDAPLPSYFHTRNRLLFGERHLPPAERRRLFVRVICETLFPRIRCQADADLPPLRHVYWLLRKGELFRRADYRNANHRARVRAVFDYARRRFGDCPSEIRALARTTTPRPEAA